MTNYDRIKSKSTPEITFPAQAALNKSHHYLFEKMIYHYGMDFGQLMNIVLAAFAFGTFITAILTFRQTKEFEKQRIRPMMQAHLRMAEDPYFCAELVISNPGQTIAHNVKFEFLPDLPKTPPKETTTPTKTPAWHQNPLDIIRQRLLGEPIQTWVPGYEITMLLWFPKEDGKFDVSTEGIPAKTTIKISYTDRYKKPTHYSDIFELNAVLLFGTKNPSTQNPNRPTKHPPRTKITPRRMRLPRSKHQQPALKTFPNPPLAQTQQRAGWGLYLCPWHQAADPTTKFDNT